MIHEQHLTAALSFGELRLDLYPLGEDLSVHLYGGERPHIGTVVLAVPRLSLTGDGSVSCTSSVINVTGHKDEALARLAAETLCRRVGVVTTCAAGFHQDEITEDQIREVIAALEAQLEGLSL